jgi:hypothetical protein
VALVHINLERYVQAVGISQGRIDVCQLDTTTKDMHAKLNFFLTEFEPGRFQFHPTRLN